MRNTSKIINFVNSQPIKVTKNLKKTDNKFSYNENIMQYRERTQYEDEELVRMYLISKLANELGYSLDRIVLEKEYATVTDWCIVGNMTMVKRCAWAIEAFRQVPDSQLTIYGNLPKGYRQEDLPLNVHYAGFLEEVPYEKHRGYLSCSMSECFANSAVEASAKGLVCLLSDTDLAHRYYKNQSKVVTTFGDIGELILWLNAYQKEGRYASATFAKDYQKRETLELYKFTLSL